MSYIVPRFTLCSPYTPAYGLMAHNSIFRVVVSPLLLLCLVFFSLLLSSLLFSSPQHPTTLGVKRKSRVLKKAHPEAPPSTFQKKHPNTKSTKEKHTGPQAGQQLVPLTTRAHAYLLTHPSPRDQFLFRKSIVFIGKILFNIISEFF